MTKALLLIFVLVLASCQTYYKDEKFQHAIAERQFGVQHDDPVLEAVGIALQQLQGSFARDAAPHRSTLQTLHCMVCTNALM